MKHILLVEDDLSMLNGLSFAIKKQGYALDIARIRDEQKQLWTEDKYDLVILDVSLPEDFNRSDHASTSSISGMGTERDHKYSGVL